MRSRREFNRAALAGLTASVLPGWVSRTAAMQVRGVKVGLITGSLNPVMSHNWIDAIA